MLMVFPRQLAELRREKNTKENRFLALFRGEKRNMHFNSHFRLITIRENFLLHILLLLLDCEELWAINHEVFC